MKPDEAAAETARHRALRLVADRVLGRDDVHASYDDLRAALAAVLSFYEGAWLDDLLDLVGTVAAAEVAPSAWEPVPLPRLTSEEMGAQTDELVRQAFEDPEAPAAPSAGMKI